VVGDNDTHRPSGARSAEKTASEPVEPQDRPEPLGDGLPLEIVDIDGQKLTFVWYHLGGVDRLSLTCSSEAVGVVEGLDTRQPRLIPDRSWSAWFTEEARAERVRAEAMRQWSHRGETVADRALAEGGQA
jgi:hypothetical protein